MYFVVTLNADAYLELDTPVPFSNHLDALKYAIEIAIVFRAQRHWRIEISGSNGPREWSIESLCTRRLGIA